MNAPLHVAEFVPELAPSLLIHRAHSFTQRLFGLLARSPLQSHEALFIAPCNSVHTVLMTYAIDVAFVDREGQVLKLVRGLKPYRAAACWGAHGVVEFAAGSAESWGVAVGSTLAIKPAAPEVVEVPV
jgi:uncharacterized protein